MPKYINSHKNYTLNSGSYQLKPPLNIEYMIPDNDSVRLLSQFVEEMDLTDLYSTYSRLRENQATPRQMLKIVLYSYMNHIYSSRAMETACKRDVNFMYLLEGVPVPDHSSFARFRRYLSKGKNNVLAESVLLAMAQNINKLHNKIQSDRTETHLFSLKNSA